MQTTAVQGELESVSVAVRGTYRLYVFACTGFDLWFMKNYFMWKRWQWDVLCVSHKVWRWDYRICCWNYDAIVYGDTLWGPACVCLCVCLGVWVCVCESISLCHRTEKFTDLLRTECPLPSQHGVTHLKAVHYYSIQFDKGNKLSSASSLSLCVCVCTVCVCARLSKWA